MIMTHDERHSALWMKLKEHMQQQLDLLRRKNDAISLGEIETAALRGRIFALKELSALDTDLTTVADD